MSLPESKHTNPEPKLHPESRFYLGWVMLPVATVMVICTLPGQTVIVSQFNTSIRESLGISLEQLSWAYLIGTLAAAFPLTLIGKLSDKLGPRITTGIVTIGLAFGCLALSRVTGIVTLTLSFFLIRLLGQGALGMLSSHLLALWFERRLSTVESIKHAGMSLAGASAPHVVIWLIATTGWRSAYAILGLCVALLVLPLVATVFRNKPEDVNQHLDNEPPDEHKRWHDIHESHMAPKQEIVFTLKQARTTLSFWCIALPGIFSGLVGTAMLFHIQPILISAEVDDYERKGAAAISAWATVQLVTILAAGPIADRVAPRILLPISGLLTACSLIVMGAANTGLDAALSLGIFGLAQGISIAASGPTIARFFGRPHHGSIRGFLTSLTVAGTALGPYLIAKGADLAGNSFALPFYISAAVALLLAALAACATKPEPPNAE